jgi:hypothetical protein
MPNGPYYRDATSAAAGGGGGGRGRNLLTAEGSYTTTLLA